MRYVPEELYLTWKERAIVSRKYATSLQEEWIKLREVASDLNSKCWRLSSENRELKSIPDYKPYKKLLKTRLRLSKAKEKIKELEDVISTYENTSL